MIAEGPDFMTKVSADDALAAKYSAVKIGYFEDPYVASMLPKSHGAVSKSMRHRQPIINRGYFARVETIRVQMMNFLNASEVNDKPVQLISLGCGYDTMSLVLLNEMKQKDCNMTIYEVDFADVIRQKESFLKNDTSFHSALFPDGSSSSSKLPSTSVAAGDTTIFKTGTAEGNDNKSKSETMPPPSGRMISSSSSSQCSKMRNTSDVYTCHVGSLNKLRLIGCDLRKPKELVKCLVDNGFDSSIPCRIVSECTLVYMEGRHSSALCRSLAGMLKQDTPSMWVSYDMTHSKDTYGRVMLRNLTNAGYKVPSFTDLPTIESHKSLFETSGWGNPSLYLSEKDVTGISRIDSSINSISENSDDDDDDDDEVYKNSNINLKSDLTSNDEDENDDKNLVALYGNVECMTMLQAWEKLVTPEEKARVNKLEMLDEVEEWNMLMSHYCLTTSCRNCNVP
jgi:O-methyltransferase involved in polyketide biosynthesis